jgi:hypothetical protein
MKGAHCMSLSVSINFISPVGAGELPIRETVDLD